MTPADLTPALQDVLRQLPHGVSVQRVETLWLFPPRQSRDTERGLVVLSLFPQQLESGEQRQIVTLRYEARQVRGRWQRTETMVDQGRAPAERIPRLIAGVVSRLEDAGEEPAANEIGGSTERWAALLAELDVAELDLANGE